MFVLVVGAGRVGSSVATSALRAGHTVSVLDEDPLSHERLDVELGSSWEESGGRFTIGTALEMDALTESLLIFAARRDHLRQRIEPALAAGNTVLCDRFTDATFAYQGAGRDFDWHVLTQLERWVQADRQPDLTLWFDVEPAQAAARRAAARQPDRLERMDEAFFERVRAGYARRQSDHPRRIVRIDARGSLASVWAQVEQEVGHRGWW